jgi:hypothetical protein
MRRSLFALVLAIAMAVAPYRGAQAQMITFDPKALAEQLTLAQIHKGILANTTSQLDAEVRQLAFTEIASLVTTGHYTNLNSAISALKLAIIRQVGKVQSKIQIDDAQLQQKLAQRYPGYSGSSDIYGLTNDAIAALMTSVSGSQKALQAAQANVSTAQTMQQKNDAAKGAMQAVQVATNVNIEMLKSLRESQAQTALQLQGLAMSQLSSQQISANERLQWELVLTSDATRMPEF